MYREPAWSGTTTGINTATDAAAVSTAQTNNLLDPAVGSAGTQSYRIYFDLTTPGAGFVRASTYNCTNRPNPILYLDKGLSMYVKVVQGTIDVSYYVRETGVSGTIGGNGGVTGSLEECTNYKRVSAASYWQYLHWDLPSETYQAVTGNGALDGEWGVLEAITFKAVSGNPATAIEVFVDDVYQGPAQTPQATPTPSLTPSLTPSPSPSLTPSPTASLTPSPTPSPSLTPSPTPSLTASPTPTPSLTPSPSPTPDVIVDNPAATFTGTWTVGTSATDKYGADYKYATSGTAATANFSANLPSAGNYKVQEWHSVGTNRSTNAPYTVNFSGGSLTYNVNQQANGGTWNTLGTFYFAAGGGQVVINAAGANGTVVIADAVRFTYLSATAPTTVTYDSVSGDDGWVLESTETSGVGGSINSANTTLNIGDDASKKQYMGILSFDTSALPDAATIQKVTLKVTRSSLAGAPYSTLGTLTVDIKPAYFGAATTLATDDFASAAGAASVATVTAPSGNNVTVSAALTSAGVFQVSKTAKTQLKLRFTTDDDNDAVADYLGIYSGNYSTTTSYRPKLEIQYTQ